MLSPNINFIKVKKSAVKSLRGRSVAASDWIWRVQNRTDLKLKSDSDAIVRLIWRLSDLKLLQIGKRVKVASYTVYRIWTEVLASVQIWSSKLLILNSRLNLKLCIRARSTTPHDMASLPTPIATLQSQLHVFYDALILTFVIAIILLPRGVRTQHTDMWRGTTWTAQSQNSEPHLEPHLEPYRTIDSISDSTEPQK